MIASVQRSSFPTPASLREHIKTILKNSGIWFENEGDAVHWEVEALAIADQWENELEAPNRAAKKEAITAIADQALALEGLIDWYAPPEDPLRRKLEGIQRSLVELGAGIADKWPNTSGRR